MRPRLLLVAAVLVVVAGIAAISVLSVGTGGGADGEEALLRARALVAEQSVGVDAGADVAARLEAARTEDVATRALAAEARRRGIGTPDRGLSERERRFAEALAPEDLGAYLERFGSDVAHWRAIAADQELVAAFGAALASEAPEPSPAQVARIRRTTGFTAPAERPTVTIVVADRAAAERVLRRLGAGEDPARLARQLSVHVTGPSGGLLVWQDPAEGGVGPDAALWPAVRRLAVGGHTAPRPSPALGGVAIVIATGPLAPARPLPSDVADAQARALAAQEWARAEIARLRAKALEAAGLAEASSGGPVPAPRVITAPTATP